MKEFKCRASCSGNLATNPQKKTEVLSETTKTYLQEWVKEQIYGVRKEISSKYLTKGTDMEDEAIDKAIEWLDLPFALKNEESFENDFFTGTPDIILSDCVLDIKNSWDCFTFPLFEDEIPTKDYMYQLQVYMHLTGLKKAKLVYMLLDTPETYNTPAINYDHIDQNKRHKVFEIDYDQTIIDMLIERVKESRIYINTLIK